MNRFFIKGFGRRAGSLVRTDEENIIKHITKSLRLRVGDKVEICFDDGVDFIAEISELGKRHIEFNLLEELSINRELDVKIDLYQGTPKFKKLEQIIQKCVECGVHAITPVDMARSISRIADNFSPIKYERFKNISRSAAEQSKRQIIPKINKPISFEKLLELLEGYDLVIMADEEECENSLKSFETDVFKAKSMAIIIGPEGGISNEERKMLSSFVKSISLGKRILRTETAGVYLLAQLSFLKQ